MSPKHLDAPKEEHLEQANQALDTIPADLREHAGEGTEEIGQEDVKPARILVCQAGHAQRKTDDPEQIKGLNELDLFNELSGEIYGRSMIIVIIKSLGHKNIQFKPGELGTVLDLDVPDNDPRAQWPLDDNGQPVLDDKGKRVKPAATKYYNYLVFVPSTAEIAIFSLKSTQIPVAIKLNGLMKLPIKIGGKILTNPPAWARSYEISTFMDKDGDMSWGAVNLRTTGITDEETRKMCAMLSESYKRKTVEVKYEAEESGDTSFDTEQMEREAEQR